MTPTNPANTPALAKLTNWSLSLNALLISVIVGLLFWRRKTQSRPIAEEITKLPNAKQLLSQISKQAANNNLAAMRDSIFLWGAEVFAQQPPRSLNQLADLMANQELKQQFDLLDQRLFKADSENASEVDTKVIVKTLQGFSATNNNARDNGIQLKPLYPDHE